MASKQKAYQVLKGANRPRVPVWGRALYLLLLSCAVASMFLWFAMDFDLNNGWLAFLGFIMGLCIGYLTSWMLIKLIPGFRRMPIKAMNEIRILYMGMFLSLTPFLLQQWNKGYGSMVPECTAYQVLEKSQVTRRRSSTRTITINRNANREKVDIDPALHTRVQPGDSLQICIATGALGFEYVTSVHH